MDLDIGNIIVDNICHVAYQEAIHKACSKQQGPNTNHYGSYYHETSAAASPNVFPCNFKQHIFSINVLLILP